MANFTCVERKGKSNLVIIEPCAPLAKEPEILVVPFGEQPSAEVLDSKMQALQESMQRLEADLNKLKQR